MCGNVTALVGWICIGKIQEQKHAPGMQPGILTGCGPVLSHVGILAQARFHPGDLGVEYRKAQKSDASSKW